MPIELLSNQKDIEKKWQKLNQRLIRLLRKPNLIGFIILLIARSHQPRTTMRGELLDRLTSSPGASLIPGLYT